MVNKTKKERIKREDNTKAKKIFLIFSGLLTWMSLIGALVAIKRIYTRTTEVLFLNIVQIIIFVLLIIGLWALFNLKNPFQNFILLAAFMNAIFSAFESPINILQLSISIAIIYLGIRFPISVEKNNKPTLKFK